ncbi:MAG: hypothetical protein J7559_20750 [Cohnella sp.]|nr:hypothetical protein [Cohnella sp.]
MITIKTRQDIEDLHPDGNIPILLVENIVEYFRQLEIELADDEECLFRLDQHGPIVLLEAGDDIRSLNLAGLGSESDEVLRSAVEFVEKLDLGEVQAYRLAALLDNDFVVTFFTQAGAHDEEVEQWLKDQAERN